MSGRKRGKGLGLRYVGRGFVPGVPARDLTEEEAEAYGREWLLGLVDPHTGEAMYEEIEHGLAELTDKEKEVDDGSEGFD